MKRYQPLVYAILIIIGICIGNINNGTKNSINNKTNMIFEMINEHYVDSIKDISIEDKAINSILSTLDPHSAYIPAKEASVLKQDMQGSFSGIGVEFNIIDDSVVVISPITGGPSEKLGIKSGDRIISVEGEGISGIGINNEGVINRLRGEKGSSVSITIKRKGQDNIIPFAIIRDDIPLYSVDAGIMLDKEIAYIKINRFSATTYNEMMKKVDQLQNNGMQKLILDLRGNPGGYLHIANQICDEFLEAGELIVFTEGRRRSKQETFASRQGSLEKIQVITLIDEGSASASEIVSGAFQDNDRGLVIGRRSFGKGLVQEQITLSDGSVVRLTTQRYHTPSGRCIQKNYGKNTKGYFMEQYTRNDTKSLHTDTIKYMTKNGRTVYGGGGITPDIIVKRDSNVNYLKINQAMNNGWINKFCFEISEVFKNKNIENFNQIEMTNVYDDFILYIKQEDSNFNLSLGETELKYLKNLLLATISRNLWDNNTYYKVLCKEDQYIKIAIDNF